MVPVSLAEGLAADSSVAAELCLPAGPKPTTVQVLVPGFTYGGAYWDFPDPRAGTERYSYVVAAVTAGYATLRFDRIGTGASAHPASALVTIDSAVWVLHQLVQALREGRVSTAVGDIRFSKIVTVGHSFGSAITWLEASRNKDVEGVILTGATHNPGTDATALGLYPSLYPAVLDPRFASATLDPGYLTTRPGTRKWFYEPASVDPLVVSRDEVTKETGTAEELATVSLAFSERLDIRVPVLVAAGEHDPVVCGGALPHDECGSSDAFASKEASSLGSQVPRVDGYLLPGAGHVMNLMPNARDWFHVANAWVSRQIEGERVVAQETLSPAVGRVKRGASLPATGGGASAAGALGTLSAAAAVVFWLRPRHRSVC